MKFDLKVFETLRYPQISCHLSKWLGDILTEILTVSSLKHGYFPKFPIQIVYQQHKNKNRGNHGRTSKKYNDYHATRQIKHEKVI